MISDVQGMKQELRRQIRAKVKGMTPAQKTEASKLATERLEREAVWREARTILLFAPMPDELDIWPLASVALAAGKRVFLPRSTKGEVDAKAAREPAELQTPKTPQTAGRAEY